MYMYIVFVSRNLTVKSRYGDLEVYLRAVTLSNLEHLPYINRVCSSSLTDSKDAKPALKETVSLSSKTYAFEDKKT